MLPAVVLSIAIGAEFWRPLEKQEKAECIHSAFPCFSRAHQNSASIAILKTTAGSISFNCWLGAYDATASSKMETRHSVEGSLW